MVTLRKLRRSVNVGLTSSVELVSQLGWVIESGVEPLELRTKRSIWILDAFQPSGDIDMTASHVHDLCPILKLGCM